MTPWGRRKEGAALGGLERRVRTEWLIVTPLLMLLTLLLSLGGGVLGLERLDHILYDRTLPYASHYPASDDIVIVAIDEGSIEDLGYWPWRRKLHAQLLERLSQARAVGADILFTETNPAYPDDDQALARAVAAHGRVVLPLMISSNDMLIRPLPELAAAAHGLGYINARLDSDGAVRSLVPRRTLPTGQTVEHLVLSMLDAAGEPDLARPLREDDQPRNIIYTGPPGSYTVYPYLRVLNGDVPPQAFAGKFVLIGAWASALGDRLLTPMSRAGEPMAGVEILANSLQNAIQDHWMYVPGRWEAALLAMLPTLAACLALRRLSPRRSFFASGVVLLLVFLLDGLLMRLAHIWIPPAASLLGVVLAFPVWSWRSQEAALRHIDQELLKLQDEKLVHAQLAPSVRASEGDASLPARVVKLNQAITLLRQAMRQREQALRFLSHDMRSPQNAILALTQLQRQPGAEPAGEPLLDRIDEYARRTLGLVDGFVQLARAESMALQLRETDLSDLLAQTCDARWPLAQRKRIQLEYQADVQGMAAVQADESMLSRAFGNLLDNAIHYSPGGTKVWCRLSQAGQEWEVAIQDQGRGISEEDQAVLFEPFRRFGTSDPGNPEGSGLGLPFVLAAVQRHGGSIHVLSELGRGSTFVIRLPIAPESACAE